MEINKFTQAHVNKERVHSALDYVSPFEFEAMYYDKINQLGQVA